MVKRAGHTRAQTERLTAYSAAEEEAGHLVHVQPPPGPAWKPGKARGCCAVRHNEAYKERCRLQNRFL